MKGGLGVGKKWEKKKKIRNLGLDEVCVFFFFFFFFVIVLYFLFSFLLFIS